MKAKQVGEKDDWFYFPTGIGLRPFVIGDLTKAKQVHIGESPWDMLALADRTDLYLNQNHAFIATRGAGNAALCNGLIPEGVSVLAWPQNDEAGKRWLDDLSTKVPVQVARAIVPEQLKTSTNGQRQARVPRTFTLRFSETSWLRNRRSPSGFLKPKRMAQTARSQAKQQSLFRFSVFRRSLKQWRKKFVRPSACRKVSSDVAHLEF